MPEIVAQYEALKMARKTAEDGIKDAQARIMHRLGHAQRARFAGGLITSKTVNRKSYVVPAIELSQFVDQAHQAQGGLGPW